MLVYLYSNVNAFTEQAHIALGHCSNSFSRNIVVK